ncbi:hypothetical protein [Clostridium carboxidivorans]|uniref:hypothetical protein n=1 Tax=Clostridium carboxidivorans TaxID=217159 RepID=UPI0018DD397E|nr:hypothetical protein [Clostridium carboxidivorans]
MSEHIESIDLNGYGNFLISLFSESLVSVLEFSTLSGILSAVLFFSCLVFAGLLADTFILLASFFEL